MNKYQRINDVHMEQIAAAARQALDEPSILEAAVEEARSIAYDALTQSQSYERGRALAEMHPLMRRLAEHGLQKVKASLAELASAEGRGDTVSEWNATCKVTTTLAEYAPFLNEAELSNKRLHDSLKNVRRLIRTKTGFSIDDPYLFALRKHEEPEAA